MMELLGNWTGVCYYPGTRAFIPDNTLRLSITMSDGSGNLSGTVTEICEIGGIRNCNEERTQTTEFRISGTFDEEENVLNIRGECKQKERKMQNCVLTLKLTDGERMEGIFADPNKSEDMQRVELYKGDVRRDRLELKELGRQFLQKIREVEGRA